MRIFLGGRAEEKLENDKWILQFNYGSRRYYSIENAILEKRLMYDLAVRDRKEMMHNLSDLEACYNQQLPNIGCLVQESVGVERELAKLFAKIFLLWTIIYAQVLGLVKVVMAVHLTN